MNKNYRITYYKENKLDLKRTAISYLRFWFRYQRPYQLACVDYFFKHRKWPVVE